MANHSTRLCVLGIALLLVAVVPPVGSTASEEKKAPELSLEEIVRLLRKCPPTPQLTARIRGSTPLRRIVGVRMALDSAHNEDLLNVLGHMVKLGTLHRTHWGLLRTQVRSASYVQGRVAKVLPATGRPPGGVAEDVVVTLTGVVLLADGPGLELDNGNLRVALPLGPGERKAVRRWIGQERVMRVDIDEAGPICYDRKWKPTGREREVFGQVRPLSTMNPQKLLGYACSSDAVLSWLATVQIVMGCEKLGDAQWASWSRSLNMKDLESNRSKIVKAFESLAPLLRWDGAKDGFVVVE